MTAPLVRAMRLEWTKRDGRYCARSSFGHFDIWQNVGGGWSWSHNGDFGDDCETLAEAQADCQQVLDAAWLAATEVPDS